MSDGKELTPRRWESRREGSSSGNSTNKNSGTQHFFRTNSSPPFFNCYNINSRNIFESRNKINIHLKVLSHMKSEKILTPLGSLDPWADQAFRALVPGLWCDVALPELR